MTSPVPYKSVDLTRLTFGAVSKDTSARLFVVPIDPPALIQTTPVVLTTAIDDPQIPFVYIQGDESLMTFFRDTEQTIEDTCIENKKEWFTLAKNLDDDILRRGFKSFFAQQGFKVKIAPDVPCFDTQKQPIGREDIPINSTVRMILEMSRISFGRHEFGVAWRVVQLQIVPVECLIREGDDDDRDDMLDDLVANSDIDEFI